MAFNTLSDGSGDPDVLVDINTTPLIDVMLVLLIMLIITIPVQLHSVGLNLPVGPPPAVEAKPNVIRIDVESDGAVRWNGDALANAGILEARLASAAKEAAQPEIHLYPNRQVPYNRVVAVMAAVQRSGLTKVGIAGNEQYL